MFTNAELVEKIRELSKQKNTSLTEIEKKFGWSNGRIGKWKNAKKRPPKQDLELIAKELEVSLETIIGAQKEIPPTEKVDGISKKDISLIKWFHSLPPETQKAILTLGGGSEDLAD